MGLKKPEEVNTPANKQMLAEYDFDIPYIVKYIIPALKSHLPNGIDDIKKIYKANRAELMQCASV